jgi:hypothetical protein
MGEHTIELTPDEAVRLFELAGFSVQRLRGVWLCRQHGQLLPLEPSTAMVGPLAAARRIALAADRPEDSFIWWAEVRKESPPDVPALREFVAGVFEAAWPERVARMKAHDGDALLLPDGRKGVVMPLERSGFAMLGPFFAVPEGTYEFRVDLSWSKNNSGDEPLARLDIMAEDELLASSELRDLQADGAVTLACTAAFARLRFTVYARLYCPGVAEVQAPLTLEISPAPWRQYAESAS